MKKWTEANDVVRVATYDGEERDARRADNHGRGEPTIADSIERTFPGRAPSAQQEGESS